VVKKETEGRSGKHEGAPAHTREVQLGCVSTQAPTDAQGYPIRDPDSTTDTGVIETAEPVRQTPLSGNLETGRGSRAAHG
jgi:hypothetical protein